MQKVDGISTRIANLTTELLEMSDDPFLFEVVDGDSDICQTKKDPGWNSPFWS